MGPHGRWHRVQAGARVVRDAEAVVSKSERLREMKCHLPSRRHGIVGSSDRSSGPGAAEVFVVHLICARRLNRHGMLADIHAHEVNRKTLRAGDRSPGRLHLAIEFRAGGENDLPIYGDVVDQLNRNNRAGRID